jgi:hypothetical protein
VVISRKYKLLTQVTLLWDLLVVAASFVAAFEILAVWRGHSGAGMPAFKNYLWVVAIIGPSGSSRFGSQGFMRRESMSRVEQLRRP